MRILHTMLRVGNLQRSIEFYTQVLGMKLLRTSENPQYKYSLAFLGYGSNPDHAEIELTYNWDPEPEYGSSRNFGHLAFRVDDLYAVCERLQTMGYTINRPPRDGHMAFVRSPDLISIELLQEGHLPPQEPWASMPNTGVW
jgi:lactoylglutathione lyase